MPGKALIVFAHPEPRSFGAALRDRAVSELEGSGWEVRVSDLYAMGFNPVASEADFSVRRFPGTLHYDREQKHAVRHDAVAPDVRAELDRVLWCDLLVLMFPLWWFSVPAILKGWVDRVFVNGVAYGSGQRYDAGGFAGRRAMVCTTVAAYPGMLAPRGLLGDSEVVLWPIHNGMLAYTGFAVLPPYVGHGVAYISDEERAQVIEGWAERLRTLDDAEPLFFHPLSDFGPDWTLLEGVEPGAVGQRDVPPSVSP